MLIVTYQYYYKQLTLLETLISAPHEVKHSTVDKLSFNTAKCNGVH